ncbi:MAG: hypothetical protein JRI86_12555, partial [Deltaproteobacteria bacterium]|nr:hypothetical protein [Deltaproteobacteria bacterium]
EAEELVEDEELEDVEAEELVYDDELEDVDDDKQADDELEDVEAEELAKMLRLKSWPMTRNWKMSMMMSR